MWYELQFIGDVAGQFDVGILEGGGCYLHSMKPVGHPKADPAWH
jgi:hypothetical protein